MSEHSTYFEVKDKDRCWLNSELSLPELAAWSDKQTPGPWRKVCQFQEQTRDSWDCFHHKKDSRLSSLCKVHAESFDSLGENIQLIITFVTPQSSCIKQNWKLCVNLCVCGACASVWVIFSVCVCLFVCISVCMVVFLCVLVCVCACVCAHSH